MGHLHAAEIPVTPTVKGVVHVPTISGGTPLFTTQGASTSTTIATVSDTTDPPGSLVVTPITLPTGISVTSIVNTAGKVTAIVAVDSTATTGTNKVVLQVEDTFGSKATANYFVNVALGTYADQVLGFGAGTTVTPTAAPAIFVFGVTVSAPGFAGTLSVNKTTGVVTIANASPVGIYTVTVVAASDGPPISTTFKLTVNSPLGSYPDTVVTFGAGTTVTPTAAPGVVSAITATAPGFSGTLSVDKTTGVVTVANASPVGVYTVTVTATTAGPTVSTTFKLTVNAAIVIISPPAATNPTGTSGAGSQFTTVTIPANNTWDFGDGTTANGSTVSHAYAAPGTYTVTMTVSDPVSGQSLSLTLQYTVNAPQFRVRLARFNLGGTDTAQITGILHLSQGTTLSGKQLVLNVGGNTRTFVLNSKGRGKSGSDSFALAVGSVKGVVAEQESTFKATVSGALAAALKANAPLDASGFPTAVTISVQLGTSFFTSTVNVKFSGGKAKFGFF
jgi:PKD repeat protein